MISMIFSLIEKYDFGEKESTNRRRPLGHSLGLNENVERKITIGIPTAINEPFRNVGGTNRPIRCRLKHCHARKGGVSWLSEWVLCAKNYNNPISLMKDPVHSAVCSYYTVHEAVGLIVFLRGSQMGEFTRQPEMLLKLLPPP